MDNAFKEPCATLPLSGWGRFPVEECRVYRPEKRRGLAGIIQSTANPHCIPRGLGRSYGDAAIDGGGAVIDYSRLNRMIAFDAETGMLECEAGVSLAEILGVFMPRGFFPSVLPGTKFITVGGAIANDVHGKNHHQDGTFSQFVESFELLTAHGEVLTCSRDQNAHVFWATVGGIGLTGLILTARIRLQPIESAYVVADHIRLPNIDAALEAVTEADENHKYTVAWVDCLAKGAHLGRSVLMRANHAPAQALVSRGRDPLVVKPKRGKSVPFDFPGFALNPWSIRAFNTVFYAAHRTAHGKIIDCNSYFCPLDAIHHWNRMYGKNGFGQYQATFPFQEAQGLVRMLERISRSGRASFLAVLKRLGPAGPGLLSYPSEGYTLTLDIPMHKGLIPLLHEFDREVLEHGGRLYCAKDASAQPKTFAAMYPKLDAFRAVKARLDPDNRFSSTMSRRLGITPPVKGDTHDE
ncbi:MAG: FAD-binding protein [Nitrospiraceae bacterium]|nr:FAD-binding protein [Nitrospiraceae bacterium]